ncbi:MAG TPA: hypothetical protein VF615_04150 [Longimicrobiaceae bacterium]|jgi:hypothetical protein
MPRPIIGPQTGSQSRLEVRAGTPARTTSLAPAELARLLRAPCTRAYVERMTRLDAGTLHDTGAVEALIASIRDEFPELGLDDLPLGWVSRCYLGAPYEVHTLDMAGCIVQHYRRGEPLPPQLERARALALHPAYAFIEVRRDSLHCVRDDGTVTPA